jgi:TetR/AcrR family transcriptional regulator, repressor for uid operon
MSLTTDKTDRSCTSGGSGPERGSNARRIQILSAAKECFGRKGFHGASIADIGRLAGVNPGHIYYYFANKEELVGAVVESELEAFFELHETALNEQDVLDAVLEGSVDAAIYHARRGNFRLWLEILAESGRNRKIADIVRTLDERVRGCAYGMLRALNEGLSGEALESRVSVQYDLLSALVSGIAVRTAVGIPTDDRRLRAEVMGAARHLFRAFAEDMG